MSDTRTNEAANESGSKIAAFFGSTPKSFWIGIAVYTLLVVGGTGAIAAFDAPSWVGIVFVVPAIAAVSYALMSLRTHIKKTEGIERAVYIESTALAFWMVMLAALAWFFMEVFAGLPHLSAIWTWVYGFVVWAVIYIIQLRRMS